MNFESSFCMGKNHNPVIAAIAGLDRINELAILIKQPCFQPNIFPGKLALVCYNSNNGYHKITSRHPKTYFGIYNCYLALIPDKITFRSN